MKPCNRKELSKILLEIIVAYMHIMKEDRASAILVIKKCLRRFRKIYYEDFRLAASDVRVRVKTRMLVGYLCSGIRSYPQSESLWRLLHEHRLTDRAYLNDHPEETEQILTLEEAAKHEVEGTMAKHPLESLSDYEHLVFAFDTMVHLAHLGPDYEMANPESSDWWEINPWLLPRGKSMLVDYWWNIPEDLRFFGHAIIEKLASEKIQEHKDLYGLYVEVKIWGKMKDDAKSA